MSFEIKAPSPGESINELVLASWYKKDGDLVEKDEVIGELESEKASLDIVSAIAGILKTKALEGQTIMVGSVIAVVEEQTSPSKQGEQDTLTLAVEPQSAEMTSEDNVSNTQTPKSPTIANTNEKTLTKQEKGKCFELIIPSLEESMTKAEIVQWFKKNDDFVLKGEKIYELKSAKINVIINAEITGILSIKLQQGVSANVGDIAAVIEEKIPTKPPLAAAHKQEKIATSAGTTEIAKEKELYSSVDDDKDTVIAKTELEASKTATQLATITKEVASQKIQKDLALATSADKEEASSSTLSPSLTETPTPEKQLEVEQPFVASVVEENLSSSTLSPSLAETPTPEKQLEVEQPFVASVVDEGVSSSTLSPSLAETPTSEKQLEVEQPFVASVVEEASSSTLSPSLTETPTPEKQLEIEQPFVASVVEEASSSTLSPSLTETPTQTRKVEIKKMSSIRKKIAEKLHYAKQSTAMLTTFNEVNMDAILQTRQEYKDLFFKAYNIKLGFLAFFVKASCLALREFPNVNSQINLESAEQSFFNYVDMGIAVSAPRGLMVPVLRDANKLSIAKIEQEILILAKKARDGKIQVAEMIGGTFTITNGGVFGSMLSTPILNPPQSAILAMHNITPRAVVIAGEVKVASVMYLALTYDHRVIDGKDAVSFLVRVKNYLENPVRMLLGI